MDSYQVKPHLSDEEVLNDFKNTKDAREPLRWQTLYLAQIKNQGQKKSRNLQACP